MPRGGKREGAGKPKGYTHKNSSQLVEALTKKYKTTPLEFMMEIMTDVTRDDKERLDAAKAALTYFHAKPATESDINLSGDSGFTLNIVEPKNED